MYSLVICRYVSWSNNRCCIFVGRMSRKKSPKFLKNSKIFGKTIKMYVLFTFWMRGSLFPRLKKLSRRDLFWPTSPNVSSKKISHFRLRNLELSNPVRPPNNNNKKQIQFFHSSTRYKIIHTKLT
jgi:hypothetical protein